MKFTMAHLLFRIITLLAVLAGIITPQKSANAQAVTQTEITGPDGSGQFGYGVTILPNGNWVIVDPYYEGFLTIPVLNQTKTQMIKIYPGESLPGRLGKIRRDKEPKEYPHKFLLTSSEWVRCLMGSKGVGAKNPFNKVLQNVSAPGRS